MNLYTVHQKQKVCHGLSQTQEASVPLRVRFWYQSKAHMRLSISD